ncbi:MAG TPA: TonB family protein [Candidatus Acidoferrum sp.]|nr:TonB family protein [Candidatus Acidoferrum sp.]
MNTHPCDPETVMAYLDGELPASRAEEVRHHVANCRQCIETISSLRRVSSALNKWTVPDAPSSAGYHEKLSQTANSFSRRAFMPFYRFFPSFRIRYVVAVCLLLLGATIWTQLSPSRITLAQDALQAKLVKESSPDPRYPEEARKKGLQGVVKLHILVAKDGSVKKLSVVSGDPILAKASLDTVRRWKYQPTFSTGKPVEVESDVEITFIIYP